MSQEKIKLTLKELVESAESLNLEEIQELPELYTNEYLTLLDEVKESANNELIGLNEKQKKIFVKATLSPIEYNIFKVKKLKDFFERNDADSNKYKAYFLKHMLYSKALLEAIAQVLGKNEIENGLDFITPYSSNFINGLLEEFIAFSAKDDESIFTMKAFLFSQASIFNVLSTDEAVEDMSKIRQTPNETEDQKQERLKNIEIFNSLFNQASQGVFMVYNNSKGDIVAKMNDAAINYLK